MAAEYQDGPAPQPPLTPVENPFIAQNTEGGGGASHEPADTTVTFPTQTPPTYTEAVRRPTDGGGRSEVTPLLSRQSSSSTLNDAADRRLVTSDHVRQQRGVARALLLWLGIGQWYSGVCIFISFVFFAGGTIVIVLSLMTLHYLLEVKMTTVAAGSLFVLISILWPCAWLWNQWNMTCGCSYAPLVTYTWLLSLLYTGVMGALLFGVSEHYQCVHFCNDCPWDNGNDTLTFGENDDPHYPCQFAMVSVWVLVAMLALVVAVFLLACIYCIGTCVLCNREPRRPPRRYVML